MGVSRGASATSWSKVRSADGLPASEANRCAPAAACRTRLSKPLRSLSPSMLDCTAAESCSFNCERCERAQAERVDGYSPRCQSLQ